MAGAVMENAVVMEVVKTLDHRGERPRPRAADGTRLFRDLVGDRCDPGFVIHPGDVRLPPGPGARALPFGEL